MISFSSSYCLDLLAEVIFLPSRKCLAPSFLLKFLILLVMLLHRSSKRDSEKENLKGLTRNKKEAITSGVFFLLILQKQAI